jgi:uncharacterized protein (TIGR02118 family)
MTQTTKIICAVTGPLTTTIPDVAGLQGYAVHLPYPGEPPEQPDHVGGVAMVWLDADAPVEPHAWFPGRTVDAYAVDEHVRFDYERTWPDAATSPGPRRISFVRRAEGISRAEMARHWGDVHSKLVPLHHPGVWRYVQNVVVSAVTPNAPDVDGIAELHFRSVDDLHTRFYDSDEGKRIVAEDVRRFLDPGKGWRMLAEETWARTPGGGTPSTGTPGI